MHSASPNSAPEPFAPGSPFLTGIDLHHDRIVPGVYPFTVPVVQNGLPLTLTRPVTFLVGENGSGKSTLLEALAWRAGFGMQGGSRDHRFEESTDGHALGRALKLIWRQRSTDGFFLRAETFFDFTNYLESQKTDFKRYGGTSFNERSHGEAFLALFENRFEDGLYLLDEPEAALSPQRQLAFLRILHQLTTPRIAQFVIATHSPILLAYPGARIYSFDAAPPERVAFDALEHVEITRAFLAAPERYLRHLRASSE